MSRLCINCRESICKSWKSECGVKTLSLALIYLTEMTIHSLVSEHLPDELASIVVSYVVREDWKPDMSKALRQVKSAARKRVQMRNKHERDAKRCRSCYPVNETFLLSYKQKNIRT